MTTSRPQHLGGDQPSGEAGAESWLDRRFVPDLVSVIVPAYNRSALLGEAIESLHAQTWASLEVIVVDDGSTDGTAERWRTKFEALSTGQRSYRLITQANAGVSAARNTGTRAARGEFFVYLDSDDRLYPEAITRYVEALRRHQADYCIAPIDCVDESGRLTEDHRRYHPRHWVEDYLFDCFWLVHGACYRRVVLERAGPWNTRLNRAEDHEYFWRIKLTSGRGHCLETVQGVYRQHSREQSHHQLSRTAFFQTRMRSVELLVDWVESRALLDRKLRIKISRQCRFLANRLMIAGDVEGKNRAIQLIAHLLKGVWHPLRLMVVFRLNASVRVYQQFVRWSHRWSRLRLRRMVSRPTPTLRDPDGRLLDILFVSPAIPDAEGSGPARRAHAVIKALAMRHRVTLLMIGTPGVRIRSMPATDFLGGRWHYLPYEPKRTERWLRGFERRFPRLYRVIFSMPVTWCEVTRSRRQAAATVFDGRRFDLVHVYRLSMVPYAMTIKSRLPTGTRFTLDIDDIESLCNRRIGELMHRNGEHEQAALYDRAAHDYERIERTMLPQFDRLYACSEQDLTFLKSLHREVRVLPNTVPAPGKAWQRPPVGSELRLLFLGLLGYYPNRDAVRWLCREIMPRVRRDVPCGLRVGGRSLPPDLETLIAETDGVECFGEFATTDEGFAQGDVLLVPLRAGGGTRIKILEAMARGIPVISTSLGIEGIAAEPDRHYLRADTAEAFAVETARLWRDSELRERLSANGRSLWLERYSATALQPGLSDL